MTRRRAATVLGIVMALVSGCAPQAQLPPSAPILAGEDLHGEHRDLADLHGSVVLVPMWASWCGPCRDEVPVLEAAERDLGPAGLEVLGLNMRDRPDAARQFLQEQGGTSYPSIVDSQGTLAVGWGVSGIPVSFLVDRDGQVVARHVGAVTQQWIDEVVAPQVAS